MRSIEEKLELVPVIPDHQEVNFSSQEVYDAAKNSLDFLAALALPTVFKYLFPPVFQAIWSWLIENVVKFRDFSQLAIGLPRGFGKTMLIKIFVLYCILFTKKQFILIVCGTQTKANNIIRDIIGMLSENNIKKVFGDWSIGIISDRQDMKHFGFRGRNIILMGAGANSDIRGITLDNERPDVMIFDDIQTKEDAKSEIISDALEDWLYSTAMKAKSPHGCLFVFIANMYPVKWSLLRRIKSNPTWDKVIVGGILNDGTSLWEELQPIRQLLKEYGRDLASGRPEVFYAEVLNDETATTNFLLDLSKLPDIPYHKEDLSLGSFIIIDPSNDKANSDHVAIGAFDMHMNADYVPVPCLKEIRSGRMSPLDTINTALEMALRRNIPIIVAESNAYQYSLLFWFNYISQQRGIAGLHFLDIYSGVLKKSTRILNMFKELAAGEQFVDPSCQPTIWQEAREYKPLQLNNVDNQLDLLTYAPKVYSTYQHLIESTLTLEAQEFEAIPLRTAEEIAGFLTMAEPLVPVIPVEKTVEAVKGFVKGNTADILGIPDDLLTLVGNVLSKNVDPKEATYGSKYFRKLFFGEGAVEDASLVETASSMVSAGGLASASKAMIVGAIPVMNRAGLAMGTQSKILKELNKLQTDVDNAAYFQGTGLFKGVEGKARGVISDLSSTLDLNKFEAVSMKSGEKALLPIWHGAPNTQQSSTHNLDTILKHRELYQLYPELRALKVEGRSDMKINEAGYSAKEGKILLGPQTDQETARSTLLHEVQHAIQEIEYFSQGTNPNAMREFRGVDLTEKRLANLRRLREEGNPVAIRIADKLNKDSYEAMKKYKANPGESEARFTESTKNLTQSQLESRVLEVLKNPLPVSFWDK